MCVCVRVRSYVCFLCGREIETRDSFKKIVKLDIGLICVFTFYHEINIFTKMKMLIDLFIGN